MIYLILDTNNWIYLASGLDAITAKHHDDLHFKLLSTLENLTVNKEITVLINDIILKEWEKNNVECASKTKKLRQKLENVDSTLSEVRKYAPELFEQVRSSFISTIQLEIEKNEGHILAVKGFISTKCVVIPITQEVKDLVFELSLQKKPPFHNGKNNAGDAAILLSAIDFLKKNKGLIHSPAIFVSNNIEEFTDGKNTKDFHPGLKNLIGEVDLQFHRVLPSALKVSEQIIHQMDEFFRIFSEAADEHFKWDVEKKEEGIFLYSDIAYLNNNKPEFCYLTLAVGEKRPIRMSFILDDDIDVKLGLFLFFLKNESVSEGFKLKPEYEATGKLEFNLKSEDLSIATAVNGYASKDGNINYLDVFEAFISYDQLMVMYFRKDNSYQTVAVPLYSFKQQFSMLP